MTSMTILICTHNRVQLLARTLFYLNKAHRPSNTNIKILVIANACTDQTVHYLNSYSSKPNTLPLTWKEESKPGKSNALNLAISMLDTNIIALVDDDHRISSTFLEQIHRAVNKHPNTTIFCGKILPDWDGSEPHWIHDAGPFAIYPLPVPRYDQGDQTKPIKLNEGPYPGGGNLFLRREVFHRIGGFSTKLGPKGHDLGGGEDSEFIHRALSQQEGLQYIPNVIQYHYVDLERFTLSYIIKKSFQRSFSVTRIRVNSKFPPRYLWRKLLTYILHVCTSLYWPEIRFYLVRTAATIGEIKAYITN